VKDGILDHFKQEKEMRPNVDKNQPDLTFVCHIKTENEETYDVSMLVDLCSEPLSHRGYRLPKMVAPLRENLAAGLIYLAGWPKMKDEVLYDPFCGSGTILIEAALIKNRVPPSFNKLKIARHTGDELWPIEKLFYFKKSEELSKNFNEILIRYYDQSQKALEDMNMSGICGGDIDPTCETIIKKELERIGIQNPISFQDTDFRNQKIPLTPFCILTNPPFGERLVEEDLDGLYYDLGEWLKKNARGNRAYIFTKHGPHVKSIHLKSKKKEVITNGDFDCRLLNFELY
jgi:putative N6-adenine-specific DNA methylase